MDKRTEAQQNIDRLRQAQDLLHKKIEEKNVKLNEKKEPIKKILTALDQYKKEVTEATLKKVFGFFEKKNNEACIYVMEALVGLMRGVKCADKMSVELYIRKHEGFMLALNRIDVRSLEIKHCQEHLENLREKYDAVLTSEEFDVFRPFRNILSKLCVLALLSKDEQAIEEHIQKRKEEIEKNEREIEQTEQLLNTVDVPEFLSRDLESFEMSQIGVLRAKEQRIEQELRHVQGALEKAEEQFFQGLLA